jgi:hypothetical protein
MSEETANRWAYSTIFAFAQEGALRDRLLEGYLHDFLALVGETREGTVELPLDLTADIVQFDDELGQGVGVRGTLDAANRDELGGLASRMLILCLAVMRTLGTPSHLPGVDIPDDLDGGLFA